MFARRRAEKALEHWQAQRDSYADYLHTAETFSGTGTTDLMLAAGEYLFLKVTGASLIEERRTGGHYQGRSSGVSVPVGPFRYRVGSSRGHYVQGNPVPTAIDRGAAYITNKRVIFQGTRQTRECAFARLIGIQHDDSAGSTTFSVSNRQKPTTIQYGPQVSGAFNFRVDLALAHFKGTVGDLVRQLQDDLARIDASRPPQAALPGQESWRAPHAALPEPRRPALAQRAATEAEKVGIRQAIKHAIERADQDAFDQAIARYVDLAQATVGGDDLGSLGHMEIVQAAEGEEMGRHTQVIRACIGHAERLADAQAAAAAYNLVAEKVNRRIDMMNSVQPGTVPEENKLERIEISGDGDDKPQPPTQPQQQVTAPHPSGYGRTVHDTATAPPPGFH